MYDPSTGAWSSTGALAQARRDHAALLLPSGRLLIVGGVDARGPLASAEVYDPATGTWTVTGSPTEGRFDHTATLLPDGRVLAVGGYGYLGTVEVYEDTDVSPARRPDIVGIAPGTSLEAGGAFTVNGSLLRGVSEAGGGNNRSSSSDVPLLTLLDLERGRLFALSSRDFSSTQVTSNVPSVRPGQYLLSVIVQGVSSGKVISVRGGPTAPRTTLTAAPASPSNQATAVFAFSANEADAGFECSLDGAAFTVCTSPVSYARLAEGPHAFQVRALDSDGNVDSVSATASDPGGTSAASDPVRFTLDTRPRTPGNPGGCGCGAGPADASWLLMGLGVLSGTVSRRRRLLARA